MNNLIFLPEAWNDYLYWQGKDKKILRKINELLRDISRSGFEGLGKPEPLKGDGNIEIAQCKGYYNDK